MSRRVRGSMALATAVVLGSGCDGRSRQMPDAPTADADGLPPVKPRGPRCEEIDTEPGKRCLQEGWFLFSGWTTVEYYGPNAPEVPSVPVRPVYLDTFLLDEHEITNNEYAEFVTRTGGIPPPDVCGYEDYKLADPEPFERTPEVSGWVAGVPEPGRGDHPVVCITRTEAQLFCEDRGGHLPTVFEWMRAARDAYPDKRRFPWGNMPPPEMAAPWPDLLGFWYLEYATVARGGSELQTLPVGSAAEGVSAAGVVDLAGSVSELLGSCAEDVAGIPDSTDPLIRPARTETARCTDGVVLAGSNWRTIADPQLAFASTVYVMRDGPDGIHYPDPTHGAHDGWILQDIWGDPQPIGPVPDTAGNGRRSWRIGWRCAYDAPAW